MGEYFHNLGEVAFQFKSPEDIKENTEKNL